MIKKTIKKSINIISNPKKEFEELNKKSFDAVVWDYLILLLIVSVAAGIFSFLFSFLRAIYLDIFLNASIQYYRMFNYSLGRSTSLMFFYMFMGTFFMFLVSIILKPIFHRIKYNSLLKIILYSLTPFLMFSWLFSNPIPLLIWSLFLTYTGIKTHKSQHIKQDSIKKRY